MDRESKAALIVGMGTITDHIDDIKGYIITTINSEDILVSGSGTTSEITAMIKCVIDNITSEMDVETYSHFALELTVYIRRLMERRYGSDSELKE